MFVLSLSGGVLVSKLKVTGVVAAKAKDGIRINAAIDTRSNPAANDAKLAEDLFSLIGRPLFSLVHVRVLESDSP
jgi:hypothetical protein